MIAEYMKEQPRAWEVWFNNNAHNLRDNEFFKNQIIYLCHCFGAGLKKGDDISWAYSTLLCANCLRHGLQVPMDAKEFFNSIRERMVNK